MDNETLKFFINQKLIKDTGQAFLFVSANPKEGKTFTCFNIAQMCIDNFSPKRIAVVDFNINNPEITYKMGNPSLGWASIPDIVKQISEFKDLADQWFQYPSREYPNLYFIPFGQNIENRMDSETINTIFPNVIKSLKNKFDLVLIDGPSILSSLSTLTSAEPFDSVFFIVEAGKTRKQVVQTALHHLKKINPDTISVIMNKRRHYIPNWVYKRLF